MAQETEKLLKDFVKARNKAILSFDLAEMKKFYKEYGVFMELPFIPSDDVIYAGCMKAVADITAATARDKKRAAKWLIEHGYGVVRF